MATQSQASPSDKPKVTTMTYEIALIGGEGFSDNFQDIHAGLAPGHGGKPRVMFLPTPGQMTGSKPSRTGAYWLADLVERLGWA